MNISNPIWFKLHTSMLCHRLCIEQLTEVFNKVIAKAQALLIVKHLSTYVQFKSNGASGNGTAGQTYIGAAVIGGSTDQWNQISATSGTAVALSSSTGLASGLNFTWSANAVYGVVPSASGFNSTSYANLMQSFAVTHSGNAAMTMQYHGLSAGQAFSLYIYGQSDGNSSNFGDTITVNGATQTLLESNISSFVNGTNYLLFNGVADASGNISISAVNAAGKSEADINGLQLSFTQVPEPASILLFGAGIAGVVVAAVGEGYCFLIDGLSYIAVIAGLLAMRLTKVERPRIHREVWHELSEGWTYLVGFAPLRNVLIFLAVIGIVSAPYAVLTPMIAGQTLSGGPDTLGLLMAASGIGALICALGLVMRKAGSALVGPMTVAMAVFGVVIFAFSVLRFRKSVA